MSSALHYRSQDLTSLAFQLAHGISSAHGEAPNQTLHFLCHLSCSFTPSKGYSPSDMLLSLACGCRSGQAVRPVFKHARICLPNPCVHGIFSDSRLPVRGQRHLARTQLLLYHATKFRAYTAPLMYDDVEIVLQGSSSWSTVVGSFNGAP